jgi:hypothetical protein
MGIIPFVLLYSINIQSLLLKKLLDKIFISNVIDEDYAASLP